MTGPGRVILLTVILIYGHFLYSRFLLAVSPFLPLNHSDREIDIMDLVPDPVSAHTIHHGFQVQVSQE
jgi:hypothetical protein